VDLRFTPPNLRALDLLGTEVLIASVALDERPPHGVAGLIDWRLGGRLSSLLRDDFYSGRIGEVLLLPGKPKLPFDKLLLLGVGKRKDFNETVFGEVTEKILSTLAGLRARTAVVQLPGRHFGGITAERAADLLLEVAGARPEHDVWTLVEPPEAQRAITQRMIQERRRVRRL
jgi:hypothetical protein